jgi:hypothetical protein
MRTQLSKTILIFAAIILISLPIMALEGLPGLSFGMSLSDAGDVLVELGFEPETDSGGAYRHSDGSKISLSPDNTDSFLEAWTVFIPIQSEEADAFEEVIIDVLIGFHGTEFDYDPELREAWWRLDEYRFLSAWLTGDAKAYVIYYGDNRNLDLHSD